MSTKGKLQLASSLSNTHTAVGGRDPNGRRPVERASAGRAPTAFRIWTFGTNVCDGGDVVFSERSAEMLIAEQTSRGRLYSFDYDHRSILQGEAPEAGRAAGWHRLEVRQDRNGNPELWAIECAWTEEARAGLESAPPMWRYYSPAYEVDPKTREVISYVNCALTNNPLTHGIPALASAAGNASTGVGKLSLARARCRVLVLRTRPTVSSALAAARAKVNALKERAEAVECERRESEQRDRHGAAVKDAVTKMSEAFGRSMDTARVAQEKAAAVGNAPRVTTRPTSSHRPNAMTKDPAIERIERAARNSLVGMSKRDATIEKASKASTSAREAANNGGGGFVDVATIERIGRQTIAANGR